MNNDNRYDNVTFLCGARDFHALDWYRSAKKLYPEKKFTILTDLIEGEGYRKLIDKNDIVYRLFIIDSLLFKSQSKIGHRWRNLIKLLVMPIQVYKIRKYNRNHPNQVYHAHSMYYLFLAMMAKIPFIGTPQGSDILIKPYKSKLYKYYSVKSLRKGLAITVDSQKMQKQIKELSGVDAKVVQNGIAIDEIVKYSLKRNQPSNLQVASIRGLTGLYRIKEIVDARNNSRIYNGLNINFIYPFKDDDYCNSLEKSLSVNDNIVGRLDKDEMYQFLSETTLVLSIPKSDSSPRSVYEAIFCGCIVGITKEEYYDSLPECMKKRIVIIDLSEDDWFDNVVIKAIQLEKVPFQPSLETIKEYNQANCFNHIAIIIGWDPRWK
nr:glycosyltransferase [uncultured Sphaerochaeta sp.]